MHCLHMLTIFLRIGLHAAICRVQFVFWPTEIAAEVTPDLYEWHTMASVNDGLRIWRTR